MLRSALMTNERLKAAKNLAAVKAFEVYVETIKEALGEESLIDALDGTEHIHTAVLLVGEKTLAVAADWHFSTKPELVKSLVAMRTKGTTPS
jgi:hypothetical protein